MNKNIHNNGSGIRRTVRTGLVILLAVIPFNLAFSQDVTISDEKILEIYEGLRVADVCDGLDMVGLPNQGLMVREIEPLWRDLEDFSHIICGVAVTARFVPTNRVIPSPMSPEDFRAMEAEWYAGISSEPFVEFIKEGSVIVLDVEGYSDVGSVGSSNALSWTSKGARGIVADGGIRDTDEIIKQKIPVYLDYHHRGRRIRPGRNEIESVNKPVSVGGVLVYPGDVIVADGDGVVVVPRKHAVAVAGFARGILTGDKATRLELYKSLGMPLDRTVIDDPGR